MNAPLLSPELSSPRLVRNRHRPVRAASSSLLGQQLVDQGALSSNDLLTALALQARQKVPLGELLIARGAVSEAALLTALAHRHKTHVVDLACDPPDRHLVGLVGASDCLRLGFIPWRIEGGIVLLATPHPERLADIRLRLPTDLANAGAVLTSKASLHNAIQLELGDALAAKAELRTAPQDSCRGWSTRMAAFLMATLACMIVTAATIAPTSLAWVLFGTASVALLFNTLLKAACGIIALRRPRVTMPEFRHRSTAGAQSMARLPKISVLVPLYHERDIAGTLVRRLTRISYPRELLEICLVVEADDAVTHRALIAGGLPPWMRVVTVPKGTVQTKPRALNYALDFTSGEIVGVYDAEDAPEPDQLYRVALRFAQGGAKLACIQGVLSFYNARTNWLSRCFFFEYAGWFRVMLPGLERLGFAIPLGGTTLFFRRDILVKLGAWDAHNVTEDADLGMRLARRGYRCEMLDTVTQEEANSRVWPWIKQRSRWLKGYAVTWCVHMRRPVVLWRELGPWKFLGFQILFLSTLTSFFLAPALWWSLATFLMGWPNPIFDPMAKPMVAAFTAFFLTAEVLTLAVFAVASTRCGPRPHIAWIFTLPVYFVFGTLAAYKGLVELLFDPFYWDKTEHGMFGGTQGDTSNGLDCPGVDTQTGLESDRQVVAQSI